jgi:hypothetical protein
MLLWGLGTLRAEGEENKFWRELPLAKFQAREAQLKVNIRGDNTRSTK